MKRFALLFVLTFTLVFSACAPQPAAAPPEPQSQPTESVEVQPTKAVPVEESEPNAPVEAKVELEYTVTDGLGREVIFKSIPQRIVVAGKAVFMLNDALYAFPGVADRVIAIADRSQSAKNFLPLVDPKAIEKTNLESEAGAEQIAPLKPDLVILKSFTREKVGKPIEELGIPVIYLELETPEQYARDLMVLGEVLQNTDRAKELVTAYQSLVSTVEQNSKQVPEDKKPRVLVLYYNDKDGAVALNIPPEAYIQTTLTKIAGGNPVWVDANTGDGWSKVNIEQIAAWDPDQIYIITYSADLTKALEALKADAQWQALRAMKDGKLYGFPTDFYSIDQPDTRWYMGLSWLAAKINPQLYPNFKMEDTSINFYKLIYDIDEQVVREKVIPIMKGDWQ
jgi:iron complex transport system substrate-binding protein